MSGAVQPLLSYGAQEGNLTGTYDILIGNNSTGPELGAGDGSGYYTDALNGVAGAGAITPDPTTVSGDPGSANVVVTASQNDAGNGIIVALDATFDQDAFSQIAFGAPVSLTLTTDVAVFDTATYPGFSVWTWIGFYLDAFEGQTVTVVMS